MEIGDKITELIHFGEGKPVRRTGRVVYIHPRRRFYIVEFAIGDRGETVRESYYFPSRAGGDGESGGRR